MEGIVKVNNQTAEAIATLTVEAFLIEQGLADEGKGLAEGRRLIGEMKKNRVVDVDHYTYLYIPDQRGKYMAQQKPDFTKQELKDGIF